MVLAVLAVVIDFVGSANVVDVVVAFVWRTGVVVMCDEEKDKAAAWWLRTKKATVRVEMCVFWTRLR